MKLFVEAPAQFSRKGMTFMKTKYTLEGVKKKNYKYRLVTCTRTGKVYVYVQIET